MRTKTYQQITGQTARLMADCGRKRIRRALVASIGRRYARNAFRYAMADEHTHIDLDELQIPVSVYAKQTEV